MTHKENNLRLLSYISKSNKTLNYSNIRKKLAVSYMKCKKALSANAKYCSKVIGQYCKIATFIYI